MIVRKIHNKLFCFRLGLKSIIALKNFSKIDRGIETELLLFSSLNVRAVDLQPLSSFQLENLFIDCFKDAFDIDKTKDIHTVEDVLQFMKQIDIKQEQEKLFGIAVGEIRISPKDFYYLTPKEIEIAYKGFIEKQELETNCTIAALRRARSNNSDLLFFNDNSEYSEASRQERLSTFSALDI